MSLSQSFESCKIAAVTQDKTGAPTPIETSPAGASTTFKTTSFFLDSSGRSRIYLPLQLTFQSEEELGLFLKSKSFHPAPEKLVPEEKGDGDENNEKDSSPVLSSVGFEVKSYPVDESKSVVVEGIEVLSCTVEGAVATFDTEVTVRATSHHWIAPPSSPRKESAKTNDENHYNIEVHLEVTPVLSVQKVVKERESLDMPDLLSLEVANMPDGSGRQDHSTTRTRETRLKPITLAVTLTHAFNITVSSVKGASIGSSLISLTIRHSNTHHQPISITNIALHPGHSRLAQTGSSQPSLANMTKETAWGYAPKTELSLPLTLKPHDAYSTVLTISAGENLQARTILSPVSVTGVVDAIRRQQIVVAGEAQWSTAMVAVEPADAFRITMQVDRSVVKVGEPMTVKLRVFNLSLESRDLMLLMAKENQTGTTLRDDAVNSAVVSEVDGYTFGVWGISGEDDGTTRLSRDHELLAVDAALLLGEAAGHHALDAELRFVPLQEGRLKVPNWKLYDKAQGKWYHCAHNLQIVAESR